MTIPKPIEVRAEFRGEVTKRPISWWQRRLGISQHTMTKLVKQGLKNQELIDEAIKYSDLYRKETEVINQFLYGRK